MAARRGRLLDVLEPLEPSWAQNFSNGSEREGEEANRREQQGKGGKYGGGKAGRKGAGKTGTGKFYEKCWNDAEEGHTAAECKTPGKPKGYGKDVQL